MAKTWKTVMLHKNDWESNFFLKKIYYLDLAEWEQAKFGQAINNYKPDIIECKVGAQDYVKVNELTGVDFCLAAVAVNFVKCSSFGVNLTTDISVDVANKNDIEELRNIARSSILCSRFCSSIFGQDAHTRLYSEWVAKAVTGEFDDICLVCRVHGEISGFITCRLENNGGCRIGLLAVRDCYRGKGIGKRLLGEAENYALRKECSFVSVSTLYSNDNAMSCYSSAGYSLSQIDFWLYWSID